MCASHPQTESIQTPLKKACSEARPRADFRTRGRLRELFSIDSIHHRYLSQIKAILTSVLKDKECAMYLFGSRAAGTHAAVSDFDIAVLAAEDISRELSQAREMLELSNIPFSVDLVDLRDASAAFGRQVQTKGILLWTN